MPRSHKRQPPRARRTTDDGLVFDDTQSTQPQEAPSTSNAPGCHSTEERQTGQDVRATQQRGARPQRWAVGVSKLTLSFSNELLEAEWSRLVNMLYCGDFGEHWHISRRSSQDNAHFGSGHCFRLYCTKPCGTLPILSKLVVEYRTSR